MNPLIFVVNLNIAEQLLHTMETASKHPTDKQFLKLLPWYPFPQISLIHMFPRNHYYGNCFKNNLLINNLWNYHHGNHLKSTKYMSCSNQYFGNCLQITWHITIVTVSQNSNILVSYQPLLWKLFYKQPGDKEFIKLSPW